MEVISPLTNTNHVSLIARLDMAKVLGAYRNDLNMDVSYLPKSISIYECNESLLRFYYPLSAAGDEKFYEELIKKRKNYYSKWKWEYAAASDLIDKDSTLLEIGCGSGFFLKEISKKNIMATGLEFNDTAIQEAARNGLSVKKEPIQQYALTHPSSYDCVCAFQVFEHTPSIRDILTASIETLKPGGLLIFGVPNNDSYVYKEYRYHPLNLPPHHILLWDPQSLKQLPSIFPSIRLVKLLLQPEDSAFRSNCYKLWLNKKVGNNWLSGVIHKTTRFLIKGPLKKIFPFGPNETVLAVYQKIK